MPSTPRDESSMRCPMPQPCIGSRASVCRTRRSRVPRRTSGCEAGMLSYWIPAGSAARYVGPSGVSSKRAGTLRGPRAGALGFHETPPALLERRTSTGALLPQELLSLGNPRRKLGQLRELSLRELLPTLGRWRVVREFMKQRANLVEGKSQSARSLNHDQALDRGVVVTTLTADARGRLDDADLLVIANGGWPQADTPPDLGNGPLGHEGSVGQTARAVEERGDRSGSARAGACVQAGLKC